MRTSSTKLRRMPVRLATTIACCGLCACGNEPKEREQGKIRQPLVAECIESQDASTLPADAWVCPADRTEECTANEPAHETIFATPPDGETCDGRTFEVEPGPFVVGTHEIVVRDPLPDGAPGEICRATLTVVDTLSPAVVAHPVGLWPPNHALHTVRASDCVTVHDACDPAPIVSFTWATSDEAEDDRGDGATAPDVQFQSCDAVDVRAERSGGGDGRVYHLGYRVRDHQGHVVDGVCSVTVPHDQSGKTAGEQAPAYTLSAPAGCGG